MWAVGKWPHRHRFAGEAPRASVTVRAGIVRASRSPMK
jgi:hypothetical protein